MPCDSSTSATTSCQPGQRRLQERRVAATEPVPCDGVFVMDLLIQGRDDLLPAHHLAQQHIADDRAITHLVGGLGASAFDGLASKVAEQSEYVFLLMPCSAQRGADSSIIGCDVPRLDRWSTRSRRSCRTLAGP